MQVSKTSNTAIFGGVFARFLPKLRVTIYTSLRDTTPFIP